MTRALEILQAAVRSYEPYLRADGELIDPVVQAPAQYSTPYHALCQAVLAQHGPAEDRRHHLTQASLGLQAALTHLNHPELRQNISGMQRETGVVNYSNHRDFFWPAVLKTYDILKNLGAAEHDSFAEQIAATDIMRTFQSRPPSNWAMVWLSGEWLRVKAGLSTYTINDIDAWLAVFFETHILIDEGFYQEPGHPNSYDLFTRYHLSDMLLNGYDGAWKPHLAQLMETGLERSLAVQLSDGSLASAYRSTGQTWTLGAQCAYFTHTARYFHKQGRDDLAAQAEGGAQRALAGFARWQRPGGTYSPVENVLPPTARVGYERYTFDANYANLAMGFLAIAISNGLSTTSAMETRERSGQTRLEYDPTYRATAHFGPYSVNVNTFPSPQYDGFGLVDVTFGPGRRFHFVSSASMVGSNNFFNLGLGIGSFRGTRPGVTGNPILGELLVLAQQELRLVDRIVPAPEGTGFEFSARLKGSPYLYQMRVQLDRAGVHVREATPGLRSHKTLLVPYLRDGGWPDTTRVDVDGQIVRFELGAEIIRLTIEQAVAQVTNLSHGYENRRGLCGLLRIDLADPVEDVRYHLAIEA